MALPPPAAPRKPPPLQALAVLPLETNELPAGEALAPPLEELALLLPRSPPIAVAVAVAVAGTGTGPTATTAAAAAADGCCDITGRDGVNIDIDIDGW